MASFWRRVVKSGFFIAQNMLNTKGNHPLRFQLIWFNHFIGGVNEQNKQGNKHTHTQTH